MYIHLHEVKNDTSGGWVTWKSILIMTVNVNESLLWVQEE